MLENISLLQIRFTFQIMKIIMTDLAGLRMEELMSRSNLRLTPVPQTKIANLCLTYFAIIPLIIFVIQPQHIAMMEIVIIKNVSK